MMHEYELLRMAMGGGGAHEVLFTDIQPVDTKGTMQWPVATRICAIIEMSFFSGKSTIRRSIAPVLRQIAVELRLRLRHHKYCYCRQCTAGIGRVTGMSPSLLDWLGG